MRELQAAVAAVLSFGVLLPPAQAQDWPTRTVTLVVPFAPGGGIDASARIQAQALGDILGHTVIVENVGGASGTVGSAKVAHAKPDGYMFLIGNSGTHAYSQSMYRVSYRFNGEEFTTDLPYDPGEALLIGATGEVTGPARIRLD